MNRKSLVATADAVAVGRPDWNQPGIISALQVLAHTWQGTDAALLAHVFAVAAMPSAHTPAAINAIPAATARPSASPGQGKDLRCYICGNTRTDCQRLHDFEVKHGLSDPHIFETHEEADANRSDYQIQNIETVADLVSVGDMTARLVPQQTPERIAAKARARTAVDTARQKSKWKPAPPPDERRVQEDQPEETPA